MISARKLRANRANSRRSTGPKTSAGRATAARNSRRHGLAIPIPSDPALSAEVDAMAQMIAGNDSPELIEAARRIAEAEVDVIRVRRARRELLSQTLSASRGRPIGPRRLRQRLELLDRAVRITTKGRMLPTELSDALIRMEAEEERSKMLPFFGHEFAIIDRYERRALSRRKFTIRAFDEARAAVITAKKFSEGFEVSIILTTTRPDFWPNEAKPKNLDRSTTQNTMSLGRGLPQPISHLKKQKLRERLGSFALTRRAVFAISAVPLTYSAEPMTTASSPLIRSRALLFS